MRAGDDSADERIAGVVVDACVARHRTPRKDGRRTLPYADFARFSISAISSLDAGALCAMRLVYRADRAAMDRETWM
jgi:hypothetical protein